MWLVMALAYLAGDVTFRPGVADRAVPGSADEHPAESPWEPQMNTDKHRWILME